MKGTGSTPQEIARVLLSKARWLVVSHFSPDADAYGASCALTLALQRLGKTAVCLNESGVLPLYDFIPGIREVQPAGVDAHTGIEGPDGRKDREKVRAFVAESRAAFAAPSTPTRN